MRIIAGELKKRSILPPRGQTQETLSEMVREALFNILGDYIVGVRFADLYAGSGIVGIEALSRGAKRVTFVENDRSAVKSLETNLARLQIGRDRARVWHNDVAKIGQSENEWAEWDVAFLDPPYNIKDNFLDTLVYQGSLQSGTLIIVKRPADRSPEIRSESLTLLDQRMYRKAVLYFYR